MQLHVVRIYFNVVDLEEEQQVISILVAVYTQVMEVVIAEEVEMGTLQFILVRPEVLSMVV